MPQQEDWLRIGKPPEYLEEDRGRCVSCGFLAKRVMPTGSSTPMFYEFDEVGRQLGKGFIEEPWHSPETKIVTVPACIRGAANLLGECGAEHASGADLDDSTKRVINRDRNCPKWYPYTPGLDPVRHLEEFRRLEIEQRREEFEERMENERQAFEERLAQRAEESEGRRHTLVLWIAAAAVILALAEVGAAILGAGPGSLIGKLIGLD